ncbi:cation-translocating P-type ATPase [Weissella paramesenteroides]|jgi:Ca2+-transporting ATPase|uniref:Cation-translocating P-type ATPase n=1 Tax=Weissella paramesenteroides TaxID=1249 RepID=A0ABD4XKM9_WEIPA|nr:cation-translocating P-type ATPase [Weissella paramesenteroides]MDF8366955.1 cation-translocating P-type ATPase [Weissella paramesenteroides]MDF8369813.1 cation-translocating P-type ATPase [Weissella paramesenteroides]MDF8371848.1 cation-translocating P-type ATPase [Weissella paramesenteroides]MDF8373322.1 cation-translocating P-type ATPase [Weissella paramesenteroides]WIG65788.1 cation-translocating P-type ATPase [Weissella paramesenteroides]
MKEELRRDHAPTTVPAGLTDAQVQQARDKYGKNEFDEAPKESLGKKIKRSLSDVATIILIIAAIISLITSIMQNNGHYFESVLIIAIVIINSVLSIYQEGRAEAALNSLKGLEHAEAMVKRHNQVTTVPITDIVVGDILVLENGKQIAADAKLIETNELRVEESALTGESDAIEKDESEISSEDDPLGDRLDRVYRGTAVVNGRGTGIVTAVGMQTEMGKIAGLLGNEEREQTPLQIRLAQLGKRLSVIAILSALVVIGLGIAAGEPLLTLFMTAVSLAVAVVPETLMIIVTITLALGVQKMAKRHAIVRRLPAVETLGSATVIASDKTGTLTQNKMTVRKVWDAQNDQVSSDDELKHQLPDVLKFGALSTNVTQNNDEVTGLPTEVAMVNALGEYSEYEALQSNFPKVFEIPFNSTRKRMTTVHRIDDGYLAVTKGAFDVLLPKFPTESHAKAEKMNEQFGTNALRVIAVGVVKLSDISAEPTEDELEKDMTLLGLVGIIDPPRPESAAAVAEARAAGIKPVMITGDHVVTASAIAREIGILGDGDLALSGAELHKMSDEELDKHIIQYAVYARVTPEDKIRIVKSWQKRGDVVAMTGDGVNDAPALRRADVGIAMGETGTDVAREAAAIVLTDDNFATIVHAVETGRGIYGNVRKTVNFLMSANMSEIVIIIAAMLFGWGSPLIATQLLFINLVADGLPGFALSREPVHDNVMNRKPISPKESIFANGLAGKIVINVMLFSVVSLLAQGYGIHTGNPAAGNTMAFIVLSLTSILHVFNIRSDHSMFKIKFSMNPMLVLMAILAAALSVLLVILPVTQTLFSFVPLNGWEWLITIGLALVPNIYWEIHKAIKSNK